MATVSREFSLPWTGASSLSTLFALVWADGALATSNGRAFTPGAAPPGSTPTSPASTDADLVIAARSTYAQVHTVTVNDLRDGAALIFDSMTLSTDDGAVCWTLSATGDASLFARMTTGATPVLQIFIDGIAFLFIVEGVRRTRGFADTNVTLTGRSLTITAGEPYTYTQNWVNDGPASAAQIVEQAQLYTELGIDWQLDDWLVPDRAYSFSGTPLAVVQRVAQSVGATLRAYKAENRIAVLPRYRLMPHEWPYAQPDAEVNVRGVRTDSYERADKPAYTGVYVSGQQQGQTAFVYLAGTAGDKLAPMVTDSLLTEAAALGQRGKAELGASGAQATVQMTLPVLTGASEPGVFEVGWIVRVVEGATRWYGMVRSVSVTCQLPVVQQTIVLERHTAFPEGAVVTAPPPPPPPAPAGASVGWMSPATSSTGTPGASNSGTAGFRTGLPGNINQSIFAGVVSYAGQTVVWSSTWTPVTGGAPSPTLTPLSSGRLQVFFPSRPGFPFQSNPGHLVVTATIDGSPASNSLEVTVSTGGYSAITWQPVP